MGQCPPKQMCKNGILYQVPNQSGGSCRTWPDQVMYESDGSTARICKTVRCDNNPYHPKTVWYNEKGERELDHSKSGRVCNFSICENNILAEFDSDGVKNAASSVPCDTVLCLNNKTQYMNVLGKSMPQDSRTGRPCNQKICSEDKFISDINDRGEIEKTTLRCNFQECVNQEWILYDEQGNLKKDGPCFTTTCNPYSKRISRIYKSGRIIETDELCREKDAGVM